MSYRLFKELIDYSIDKVPYYRELFSKHNLNSNSFQTIDDVQKIPLLDRETVQRNIDSIISEECMHFPLSSNIVVHRTSGSTGVYLRVLWSRYDLLKSLLRLWNLRKKYYNIDPLSKFCSFQSQGYTIGSSNNNRELYNIRDNMLFFNKVEIDDGCMLSYYNEIVNFEPDWLFIQPSIAYKFSNFIEANNMVIPKSLKYIELMGEYVFPEHQARISRVLEVPVANMYGCMESNGIAYECPNGHLHSIGDNTIVEVLKDGERVKYGEVGDIYITCLTNHTMPFIRYGTGDRGILYPSDVCNCGNKNPVLKILAGRINENLKISENKTIDSFVLANLIENANKNFNNAILQFKAVQLSYEKIILYLVNDKAYKNWLEAIKDYFTNYISKTVLNVFEWDIQFTQEIPIDQATGKYRFVVSKI